VVAVSLKKNRHHGWGAADCADRICGHDALAVWTPALTRAAGMSDARGRALWGKTGRKVDPTGRRSDGRPILDVGAVRRAVSAALRIEGGRRAD